MALPRHRFYVPPERWAGEIAQLSSEQARQIAGVLRLRAGDRVRLFDGVTAQDREAVLTRVERDQVEVTLGERYPQPPEPRTRLVAYPALLPRDRFEQVLQKLVEVGVAAIVPVAAARALVKDEADTAKRQRWERIAVEAAEQCGRGVVPSVGEPLRFAAALERATANGPVLLAYEAERRMHLVDALSPETAPEALALFTGPEGGFELAEVEQAQAAGARLVSLGPRILRAETAAPVFAALTLQALGEI
jgi:16S rRNA (uracil1498-N3)-methyltransferase